MCVDFRDAIMNQAFIRMENRLATAVFVLIIHMSHAIVCWLCSNRIVNDWATREVRYLNNPSSYAYWAVKVFCWEFFLPILINSIQCRDAFVQTVFCVHWYGRNAVRWKRWFKPSHSIDTHSRNAFEGMTESCLMDDTGIVCVLLLWKEICMPLKVYDVWALRVKNAWIWTLHSWRHFFAI